MSDEIKIIKYPILNKIYKDGGALDVVIKFVNGLPIEIMCPEFAYYLEFKTGATKK